MSSMNRLANPKGLECDVGLLSILEIPGFACIYFRRDDIPLAIGGYWCFSRM